MEKKKLSSAQQGRYDKERKILDYYDKMSDRYATRLELYYAIARKVGCGYNKVIFVLQDNGIIEPRKRRNNDTDRA